MVESMLIEGRDARQMFDESLKEVSSGFELGFREVLYLSDVLMSYARLGRRGSSPVKVHSSTTKAFVFQVREVFEECAANLSGRYSRMRSLGDVLLFSVGFFPESILSRERRARPPIEYYAGLGSLAYSSAAEAKQFKSIHSPECELMYDLAQRFPNYAGALFEVRKSLGGIPFPSAEVSDEMDRFLDFAEGERDDFFERAILYDLPKKL